MIKLALFVRAFNSGQLKEINGLLQDQFEELDAEAKISANLNNRWVQVEIEGEDEAVIWLLLRVDRRQSASARQVLRQAQVGETRLLAIMLPRALEQRKSKLSLPSFECC